MRIKGRLGICITCCAEFPLQFACAAELNNPPYIFFKKKLTLKHKTRKLKLEKGKQF